MIVNDSDMDTKDDPLQNPEISQPDIPDRDRMNSPEQPGAMIPHQLIPAQETVSPTPQNPAETDLVQFGEAPSDVQPAQREISPQILPPRAGFTIQTVFWGPNGLRAGWRLLMFVAVAVLLQITLGWFLHRLHKGVSGENFRASTVLLTEVVLSATVLGAAAIMARIERRSLAEYGLPLRAAVFGNFVEGLLWGFFAESATMGILFLTGNLSFDGLAQHGLPALKYGLLWGLAFLGTGMFEEFSFRGYPQFTLTTGIGFWPAAFLLSGLFWLAHMANPGETWIGGLATAMAAITFCVALRRTGNLWFPIGMHAAWDWTETYFFGVPDSGMQAHGYLLNSSLHGSKWMTGGTVGPEGSVIELLVVLAVITLLCRRFPKVRYPNQLGRPLDDASA
jgi:membrane protease YdiL (CAAX protease family)